MFVRIVWSAVLAVSRPLPGRWRKKSQNGADVNEVLKKQIQRKLEELPEEKQFQVLDYIRFLESEYADVASKGSGFQRVAERVQDEMRRVKAPATAMRETMRAFGAADRVVSSFREAAKEFLAELEAGTPEPPPPTDEEPPRKREIVVE